MKYTKYPKETIKKAQLMYERGHSLVEIAKTLGVKRMLTVYDWSKKLGWKRMEDLPHISIVSEKVLDTFERLISFTDNIISELQGRLQNAELTNQDLTRIMEKLPLLIKYLKTPDVCTPKLLDSLISSEIDQKNPKENVLRFLSLIDKEPKSTHG